MRVPLAWVVAMDPAYPLFTVRVLPTPVTRHFSSSITTRSSTRNLLVSATEMVVALADVMGEVSVEPTCRSSHEVGMAPMRWASKVLSFVGE